MTDNYKLLLAFESSPHDIVMVDDAAKRKPHTVVMGLKYTLDRGEWSSRVVRKHNNVYLVRVGYEPDASEYTHTPTLRLGEVDSRTLHNLTLENQRLRREIGELESRNAGLRRMVDAYSRAGE